MKRKMFCLVLSVIMLMSFAIGVSAEKVVYTDVDSNSWYYNAVETVSEKGYMSGTGNNKFEPNSSMTRAMFVQVLANYTSNYSKSDYDGNTSFTDVPATKWYASAVHWASKNNIVAGISKTKFSPDSDITRQEMVVMLYNYAKATENDTDISWEKFNSFTDNKEVASWAKDAVAWATGKGIINGKSSSIIAPKDTATRAEVAAMFTNASKILTKNTIKNEVTEEKTFTFKNDTYGFELNLPTKFKDQIIVETKDNWTNVIHKASSEAEAGGLIFSIVSICSNDKAGLEESLSWAGTIGIVESTKNYIHILCVPTDVQFPDSESDNYKELCDYFLDTDTQTLESGVFNSLLSRDISMFARQK